MSEPHFRCADVEEMLADYVDQTLLDRDVAQLKAHFAICSACRELAADAAAAVAFMERAAVVEPPPQLVNRILFEIGNGGNRQMVKPPVSQRLFGKWLQPILQPKFAMGMAMTMLSFGMFLRMEGVREWADLHPANLYAAVEDRVTRLWDRGVKHYQSLKLVYEIQTSYQNWVAEQERLQEQQKEAGKDAKGVK